MGRRSLGNCFLQQGACCICLEPLRSVNGSRSTHFLPREDVSKVQKSVICNSVGLEPGRSPSHPSGVRFQALRVVDSAQRRPEKSMGLNSVTFGLARCGWAPGSEGLGSVRSLIGALTERAEWLWKRRRHSEILAGAEQWRKEGGLARVGQSNSFLTCFSLNMPHKLG